MSVTPNLSQYESEQENESESATSCGSATPIPLIPSQRRGPQYHQFYYCYLLRSEAKPRSFYIGSTPDIVRRLRQHNGDLKAGGAYKTKRQGFRPWRCCAVVYGFPSKISALAFEHAWQHAYQTRHILVTDRVSKTRKNGSGTGIHHKIANLRLLLFKSEFFTSFGLKLQIFDKEIYDAWCLNKYRIDENGIGDLYVDSDVRDPNTITHYEQLEQFVKANEMKDIVFVEKHMAARTRQGPVSTCTFCKDRIKMDKLDWGFCYDCNESFFHLICAASQHNVNAHNNNNKTVPTTPAKIIPDKIECQNCQSILRWPQLIRVLQIGSMAHNRQQGANT